MRMRRVGKRIIKRPGVDANCPLAAMESCPGSAFQPLSGGRRQWAFRKLITEISEHLLPDEVLKCSFIHNLPKTERSSSALHTLESLMQGGMFSHSNVDPLVKLLKDINRHDLVNEQVETFLTEFPATTNDEGELSQSLPAPTMTEQIPLERRSNTTPSDIAHSSIPHSLAVHETAFVASTQSVNTTPAPSLRCPSSHEYSNSSPQRECSTTEVGNRHTPQPLYGDPSPESGEVLTPRRIPVKCYDGEGALPHHKIKESSSSNSSSFNELQRYASQSNEHLLESSHVRPYSQPEDPYRLPQSVATPTDTPTTPHGGNGAQPKLKRGAYNKTPSGLFMTALPHSATPQNVGQRGRESLGSRSLSESRPRRSMTPPANLNKRISEPNFPHHTNFAFNSPARQGNARPGSRASGWSAEASQPSPCQFLADPTHQDDCDVFPHSQQSPQADGYETSQVLAGPTEGRPDSAKLFRKRPGSKKRILKKFTRNRDRSSSIVTWSVKRSKLNEAIYEHRKDKLFRCPRELELENGGKYPPRLTLYLHPYGYEDDTLTNLTLTVSLDASVKCHIPSSAVIRMEISASESGEGKKLNHIILDCRVDSRIVRHKGFLSHKDLRELKCESIDFTASAKLYTTDLTD